MPSEGELQRVEVGATRSRRLPAVALAAVAALVIGGLVLGGSDDRPTDGSAEEATSTTAERASTSTTRARATSTSSPSTTELLGPILPVRTGGALLLPSESPTWTWLDLDTGLLREVQVRSDQPYGSVPVRHGIVVLSAGAATFVPLPEGSPVELGDADQILSAGLPDAVWLLRSGIGTGLPGETGIVARLVDLAGATRATVAVPQLAYAFAATAEGLVFNAGGRAYLAGVDGARQLALGDVLAVEDPFVLLLTCDERAVCAPVLLDTISGRRATLPTAVDPNRYGVTAVLSSTGESALLYYGGTTTITTHDASGRVTGALSNNLLDANLAWLPGGAGLAALGSAGVVVLRPDGAGALVREPIAGLARPRADQLFVIPD